MVLEAERSKSVTLNAPVQAEHWELEREMTMNANAVAFSSDENF